MRQARIGLQATLNGPYTKEWHPAVPLSIEELAQDAVACVAVGARAIHLHPRDSEGRERLMRHRIPRSLRLSAFDPNLVSIRSMTHQCRSISVTPWPGCRLGRP